MVDRFDKDSNINFAVPVTICPGDVLTITFPSGDENWDPAQMQEYINIVSKTFPKNDLLILFGGVKLGIIKHEP